MANGFDPRLGAQPSPATTIGRDSIAVDAGLRSYMLSVYNYMTSGVLLTGIVALLMARSGAVTSLIDPTGRGLSGLGMLVVFSPLALVLIFNFGFQRLSLTAAKALFWAYAALIGASLSTILLIYTATSVAQTFFATAAGFASLSLWGYTTKRDLSAWGSFLLVGIIGLLVAMVINIFWPSGPLGMAISLVGLLIFAGLTAFRTQAIKSIYFQVRGNGDLTAKIAVYGALQLYITFLNMFLFLLNFTGDRR